MLDEFWQNAVGLFGLFRAPFLCHCCGCTGLPNLQEVGQVELKGFLPFLVAGNLIHLLMVWLLMPGGSHLSPPQTGSSLVL